MDNKSLASGNNQNTIFYEHPKMSLRVRNSPSNVISKDFYATG